MISGESMLMKVDRKDLRISRDWLEDRWIDIQAKPDITSTIFTANKDADSAGFANLCHNVLAGEKSNECLGAAATEDPCPSSEPNILEEKFVCSHVAEDGDLAHDTKPPSEKCNQVDDNQIHGSCDIKNNGGNNVNDITDNGDNKNGSNDNIDEQTSGPDCKGVELMEVAEKSIL